jgi:TPR repeat protein
MLNAENGIKNAQEKATYLLKIASKKGNLKAQFKLAEQLYQLPQAETDQVEAIEIYQDLCKQDQWEACFKLGRIYEQRKSERSLVLFDLACRGGIKEACR